MGTRLSASTLYAHLWGTPETDALFDEPAMLQSWLDILVALARAQASLGIVPAAAAEQIARGARVADLDLAYVAEQTRLTSHSTLGLIRGLQRVLPAEARELVYLGATVQDVTDTWFGTVLREVGDLVAEGLRGIEARLHALAAAHRDTPMAGRTHGQPGSPITFGYKAASWADEVGRHLDRLREGRARWCVGQLAGAVGALGFFGADGPALRRRFCAEVGLADPGISWTTARDRIAEFGGVLALVCGTLARIGGEVYELARPEIGELAEAAPAGAVSSITMPHKRNPEGAEHLDTLARLARASAGVLLEGVVGGHERDGRSWKAEWIALPEVCQLAATSVSLAGRLLDGLVVRPDAMAANLARAGGLSSERVLAGLARKIGKHRAQQELQDVFRAGADPAEVLVACGLATEAEVRGWSTADAVAAAGAMVDTVLARGGAMSGGAAAAASGTVASGPAAPAPATVATGRAAGSGSAVGSGTVGGTVAGLGSMGAHARFALGIWPTPLVRARRLDPLLGGAPLLVKRDDLAGFAVAGNKTRPLEHLLGAALAADAEVLVTGGGPGSNFVAAAAVAARVAGLACELVVWGDPAGAPAVELARAAGARIRPTGDSDRAAVDRLVAERAVELGPRAYPVPRGGSTPVGALGFADAADELVAQLDGRPTAVVLPVGSGGSCGGLLAGLAGRGFPVVGVSVSRPPVEVRASVLELARGCAALRGTPPPDPGLLEIVDARGPGFGRASTAETEAALTVLRTEGLLLDPTYGAEAFAVAVARTRDAAAPVVWWHTGGVLPAGAWLADVGGRP